MNRKLFILLASSLLVATNFGVSNAAIPTLTSKQSATVKSYFAAIATSQPAKINAGKKNAAKKENDSKK